MSNLPVWTIIPASGIGQRMQAELPKQYLKLSEKTIIEHTLDKMLSHDAISGAVVVLDSNDKHWDKLNYQTDKPLILATGGEQRQHSVFNGLEKLLSTINQDCFVLVHDAVRPLVAHADITQLIEIAHQHKDGALLAAPVADTLKQQDLQGNSQQTISRVGLWRAFTPQIFRASLLSKALQYVMERQLAVTDDASAMEAMGLKPKLVPGSAENIKITLAEDLLLAKKIWKQQTQVVKE
jgi:2-C-methyl-D-erythritol 4-phosphate cytidylyltransferase